MTILPIQLLKKVGFYLGQATANIANILNPDSVVIGGGVSAAGEFLRSRVEKIFLPATLSPQSAQNNKKSKIAETWKMMLVSLVQQVLQVNL